MTFLTPAELVELTGYKRPLRQVQQLVDEYGITPFVSAKGRVLVTRDAVQMAQRRMSGFELQAVQRRGPRPNLRGRG